MGCGSVTIPHKEEALNLCDVVDPIAKVGWWSSLVPKSSNSLFYVLCTVTFLLLLLPSFFELCQSSVAIS